MVNETKPATSMTCSVCNSNCQRFGKHRNGLRRFRCLSCRKTYTEAHHSPLNDMRLPTEKAVTILQLLVEGMSVRSVERVTGVHRDTILRLLVLAGQRCQNLMDRMIVDLPVKDVQADEIWGFVGKKEQHKFPEEETMDEIGSAYCFVGMERHTKLVLAFHLGKRDRVATALFIRKLKIATSDAPYQITTDGFKPYIPAIDRILGDRVDYAQLIKVYGTPSDAEQRRYSPGEVIESEIARATFRQARR